MWDYIYLPGSQLPIEQISVSGSSPTVNLLLSDENANVRGLVQLSGGTHQDELVVWVANGAGGSISAFPEQ